MKIDWKEFARKDSWDALLEAAPELSHMPASPQNPRFHYADVWGHTKEVLRHLAQDGWADNPVVMASGLLHDAGKGLPGVRGLNKEGQPSDHGHERVSAQMAPGILARLCPEMTATEVYAATWLVANHMKLVFPMPEGADRAARFAREAFDELAPKGLETGTMLSWLLALYKADMLSTTTGLTEEGRARVAARAQAYGRAFSQALS